MLGRDRFIRCIVYSRGVLAHCRYLVDRVNLLLFVEEGPKNKQRLLSLQECYELMVSAGVSIDWYIVYCKLMRAGFVCHRCGIPWTLKSKDEIRVRNFQIEGGGQQREERPETVSDTSNKPSTVKTEIFEGRGNKEKDSTPSTVRGKRGMQWWAEYEYHDKDVVALLPKCNVITQECMMNRREKKFPRMLPLRTTPDSEVFHQGRGASGALLVCNFLLLFRPAHIAQIDMSVKTCYLCSI